MSDYMFMLENHLNGGQGKALAAVREAAEKANLNLFLTGGAMRDMMGGFPIRDLDFTVEGGTINFAKAVAQRAGAELLEADENRNSVELRFPGNITAGISMAVREVYPRPGAAAQLYPATIHEDLRRRDFTVNAIALSLGKASRGLLLDPANGLGDLSRKELRTVTNHAFSDDPSRLLRLVRLRTRLGFNIEERTLTCYRNAREEKLEAVIPAPALEREFRQIALDLLAGEILKALEEEGLLYLFSPALSGAKLNLQGFQRLQKARQSFPPGIEVDTSEYALFIYLIFERLTPKERAQLSQKLGLPKASLEAAAKLEGKAAKVERELAIAKLQRPSALYATLSKVPGEVLLFLLMRSGQRLVIDRIRNYLSKYLPVAQEVTEKDVIDHGVLPGTPKFAKLHQQLIAQRLDARPKKVIVPEPPPPPPSPAGRRSASAGR